MVPDITIFGQYTYLVTLVFWGSIALVLLVRANALRRAAKTVLVLYPIGYVWDWYSLEVGVFDIVLRTGIDVLGIPLEEHLFILVIPSLVVGVHETLHGAPDRASDEPARSVDDTQPASRPHPAEVSDGGRDG